MTRPNFLVIGAAKGGTTSLHHYLRRHPEVFLPAVKETNYYWTEARDHGRKTPQNLQQYERLFDAAKSEKAIGEVSPQYLNSTTAAERIRRDLPGVRLVVSLRNPADRAWSDYLGRLRILRESRSFEEAIAPGEPCLDWGFYYPRLKRYFDLFPREQIHVILHEDFSQDSAATLRALFSFIGVNPGFTVDTSQRHNAAAVPRSIILNHVVWRFALLAQRLVPTRWLGTGLAARVLGRTYRRAPEFPAAQRAQLVEIYRDDVGRTAELIGRDLSAWLIADPQRRTP